MQGRTQQSRLLQLSSNAIFDEKESGIAFQHADESFIESKLRKSLGHFSRIETVDVQIVFLGRGQHA